MALNNGSSGAANSAGKQLGPISQTSSVNAATTPTFDVLDIISSHIDGLHLAKADSGVSTGESGPTWGVWGQAFGGGASQDAREQVDGYNASFAGLLFGADRAITDNWRVGAAVSYSNAGVGNTGDTSGDNMRVNSYGLIGYASYVAPTWYAKMSAGVMQQHYDTTRLINFTGFSGDADGSFNGQQYVAHGEVGYPIAFDVATMTPLAGLTYSYLRQGGYTERGGNGAALAVDASNTTSVTSDFGAKVERAVPTSFGTLVPSLQLAWRHEYDDTRTSTTASFAADTNQTGFTTLGANPVMNSAIVTVDLTLMRASTLSLVASYQSQLSSGYVCQTGSLRLRQLF
jgi:outer membrane autotransporter protein